MDRSPPRVERIPGVVTNPSWPSLYNPRSELFNIPHHNPIQPNGYYLVDSGDVFRFTLYWTLVFYIPVFVLFGLYAFFNLTFPPPKRRGRKDDLRIPSDHNDDDDEYEVDIPMIIHRPPRTLLNGYETLRSEVSSPPSPPAQSSIPTSYPILLSPPTMSSHGYPPSPNPNASRSPSTRPAIKKSRNARRSRVTFALLVLLFFLLLSLIGAVISSVIIGYVLTGLYKAGKFYMSTWVPFLWAAISVMVGMLNVWPSVINII